MKGWILKLRPVKSDVPPYIRLRGGLKALLRAHGLEVTEVREIPNEEAQDDADQRNGEERQGDR